MESATEARGSARLRLLEPCTQQRVRLIRYSPLALNRRDGWSEACSQSGGATESGPAERLGSPALPPGALAAHLLQYSLRGRPYPLGGSRVTRWRRAGDRQQVAVAARAFVRRATRRDGA